MSTAPDRIPLSHERIVEAAVDLVDAHGIEALSMRKLGAELGVEAMSLYNHVANKDALVDAMLEYVLRKIEVPDRAMAWDDQLRAISHSFRRAGHRHPGILPIFGQRAIKSVEGFAPLERAYVVLREQGLGVEEALDAFMSFAGYVLGFVQTELGGLVDIAEGRTIDFSSVDTAEHPWLVEMGMAFASRDSDHQFEAGLDLLVTGVARHIAEK